MLKIFVRSVLVMLSSLLINTSCIHGQKTVASCMCSESPQYNSIIKCDTIKMRGEIRLFYQFNCDSAWLTLEKKGKYTEVLNVFNRSLIELSPKLGYQFIREYSGHIMFVNRQASGGGIPEEYELISKKTGKVSKKLGPLIFYGEDDSLEMVVSFHKDTVPFLKFYNIESGAEHKYPLFKDKNDITEFMNNDMFPESHFSNPKYFMGVFTVDYAYRISDKSKDWMIEKITIDTR